MLLRSITRSISFFNPFSSLYSLCFASSTGIAHASFDSKFALSAGGLAGVPLYILSRCSLLIRESESLSSGFPCRRRFLLLLALDGLNDFSGVVACISPSSSVLFSSESRKGVSGLGFVPGLFVAGGLLSVVESFWLNGCGRELPFFVRATFFTPDGLQISGREASTRRVRLLPGTLENVESELEVEVGDSAPEFGCCGGSACVSKV